MAVYDTGLKNKFCEAERLHVYLQLIGFIFNIHL